MSASSVSAADESYRFRFRGARICTSKQGTQFMRPLFYEDQIDSAGGLWYLRLWLILASLTERALSWLSPLPKPLEGLPRPSVEKNQLQLVVFPQTARLYMKSKLNNKNLGMKFTTRMLEYC